MKGMDTERVLELAQVLEGISGEEFNMSTWMSEPPTEKPDCKTAACIAGWACIWFEEVPENYNNIQGTAIRLLGFDGYAQDIFPLFQPDLDPLFMDDANGEDAGWKSGKMSWA